jgi:RNA-directed DNA polymerase
MAIVIDLEPFFSADAIKAAYAKYKESKTDRFKPNKIKIPMGADGITWWRFEHDLDWNAQNISRHVLEGSYRFYPFREMDVEKPGGGVRTLSIAGMRDALVQRQLYEALYESAEAMFVQPGLDQVSFAYRRGKSAPYAAHRIWQAYSRDGYGYAFDADIRKFFDTLNHERLRKLVDAWVGRDTIVGTLLWRYIRTDRVPYDSYPHEPGWEKFFETERRKRERRLKGVPQGGVLSGMLANLYLHEFDGWVVKELSQQFDLRYFRYADDFVILTHSEGDARALYNPVAAKVADPLLLELHPLLGTPGSKTKISVIANGDLVFVGFHFMENRVRAKPENIRRFKKRFLAALHKERTLKSTSSHWAKRLRLAIRWCVNPKILGPRPELCPNCGLPKDRRRSWMAFFAAVVTDEDQLRQLDRWMRRCICKYFRDNYRVRLGRKELREAGMKTLVGEHYRIRQAHDNLCNCERDSRSTE